MQVAVLAGKDRVRLDLDLNIEIAGRPPVLAALAFAGKADPVPRVHAGRHAHREGLLLLDASPTPTMATGLLDHTARPATGRTGLLDGEEALLHPHLTASPAGRAGLGLGTRLGPGAAAELTLHLNRNAEFDLLAADRVLETERQVVAQIHTALGASSARAPPEDVPEDVPEDIGEGPAVSARTTESARTRIHAGMAELIVGRAFLRIAQDIVGQLGLFELRLGIRIPAVAIRVILHRQATECLFEIGLARVARDAQDLVIIAFCH